MIKVTYEESLPLKDDLLLLLEKHYETSFNTDEVLFLNKLSDESTNRSKGTTINKDKHNRWGKILELDVVDVLKDDFIEENMNLQCIVTFYIDGASAIPIENNFWHYFLLYETTEVILL